MDGTALLSVSLAHVYRVAQKVSPTFHSFGADTKCLKNSGILIYSRTVVCNQGVCTVIVLDILCNTSKNGMSQHHITSLKQ